MPWNLYVRLYILMTSVNLISFPHELKLTIVVYNSLMILMNCNHVGGL